jgi:hypothetical protein
MRDTPEVAAARLEAEHARKRFLDSLWAFEKPILDLKRELTPSHIMSEAWQGAKEKGADLAEDAVDAVRARPIAATGAVAAIALFLAREPLMDLAGKLIGSASKNRPVRKSRKLKPSQTETVE